MKQSKLFWRICVALVIVIIAVTFSPLVLNTGKIKPQLFGFPFTLWFGILLTVLLIVLTYIGGKVSLTNEEDE